MPPPSRGVSGGGCYPTGGGATRPNVLPLSRMSCFWDIKSNNSRSWLGHLHIQVSLLKKQVIVLGRVRCSSANLITLPRSMLLPSHKLHVILSIDPNMVYRTLYISQIQDQDIRVKQNIQSKTKYYIQISFNQQI